MRERKGDIGRRSSSQDVMDVADPTGREDGASTLMCWTFPRGFCLIPSSIRRRERVLHQLLLPQDGDAQRGGLPSPHGRLKLRRVLVKPSFCVYCSRSGNLYFFETETEQGGRSKTNQDVI